MLYYVRKLVNISLLLMYRILYRIVQTDKKTVLFMSFHGRSFSDNPRALYQEMKQQDRFSDFSYVWVVRDASMRIEGAKTVKFGSLAFFYYLAKEPLLDLQLQDISIYDPQERSGLSADLAWHAAEAAGA